MTRHIIPAALVLSIVTAALVAQDDPGLKVYQTVSPSVVSLKSIEGSGTGFVLEEDGLVLTNAHVVTSPLPYQMRVDVLKDGKTVTMIFKKVKIEGIHPKLDLALVRVDAKGAGVKLIPVAFSKNGLLPGQSVYAIGNPGAGDGSTLDKTITRGIVSATSRIIEGVPYIQHDAAINPGNSGGPLCNAAGEIVGVNTLKAHIEGVGYALPMDKFRKDIFVPLDKREKDDKKVEEILAEADRVMGEIKKMRQVLAPDDPRFFYARAYVARLYSMALAHDPGNKALYLKIGSLFHQLEEPVMASAYLAKGIELDPWFSHSAYIDLGQSLGKLGKGDMATLAFNEAIAKFPRESDQVAVSLAQYSSKEKQYANAAYYSKLAIHIGVIPRQEDEMNGIYEGAMKKLGGDEADKTRKRCDGAGEELKAMKSAAVIAKASKQKFLNKEFETFLHDFNPMPEKSEQVAKGLWGEDDNAVAAGESEKPLIAGTPTTPTTTTGEPMDAETEITKTIESAKKLVSNKDKDKAVVSLKALVAKYPAHPQIRTAKDLLTIWDKPDKPAVAAAPEKPKPDPTTRLIERKIDLALLFKKSGQMDKAIETLQALIDEHPTHDSIGRARDLLKQWGK